MHHNIQSPSKKQMFIKTYGQDLKIYGYASVFNVRDREGDIVLPGAFLHTLKQKKDVKLLWQHKADQPIGKIDKLREDVFGLYIEARIFGNLEQTRNARTLLHSRVVNSLSIGYMVNSHFYDKHARYLKSIDLIEVSIVTFPANEQAKLKLVA